MDTGLDTDMRTGAGSACVEALCKCRSTTLWCCWTCTNFDNDRAIPREDDKTSLLEADDRNDLEDREADTDFDLFFLGGSGVGIFLAG